MPRAHQHVLLCVCSCAVCQPRGARPHRAGSQRWIGQELGGQVTRLELWVCRKTGERLGSRRHVEEEQLEQQRSWQQKEARSTAGAGAGAAAVAGANHSSIITTTIISIVIIRLSPEAENEIETRGPSSEPGRPAEPQCKMRCEITCGAAEFEGKAVGRSRAGSGKVNGKGKDRQWEGQGKAVKGQCKAVKGQWKVKERQ